MLKKRILAALLAGVLLSGCGASGAQANVPYPEETAITAVEITEEAVALAEAPSVPQSVILLEAVASGTRTKESAEAVIDYSNVESGYVMMRYTAETTSRLKAQVKGPTTTYTYNLTPGKWEVFPLSDGDGAYTFTVYRNVADTKYAAVVSASCEVLLTDAFGPFLYSNQYVDYAAAPRTTETAAILLANIEKSLEKVGAVYHYVVENLTYDREKAATVQSGYLPVLDTVLETKKGICFDYAALMAGMLRSQGIPCKLVVGYAGTAYHAWISVWSEETGWVDGAIYFDGAAWHRMDPTYASSGKQSADIMAYIGNGANYTAKYLY